MQDLCTTLRFLPYFQGYFHDLFRFCLVFSSLIRTFAIDHWHDVQV